MLKSNKDKMLRHQLSEHKMLNPLKREHPRKCEQTAKLMLICSDVPKKAITEIHILGTVRSSK